MDKDKQNDERQAMGKLLVDALASMENICQDYHYTAYFAFTFMASFIIRQYGVSTLDSYLKDAVNVAAGRDTNHMELDPTVEPQSTVH